MRVFAQALFPAALSLILAELTCFMVVTMEEICIPPPISCIFPITLLTQQAYFIFSLFAYVAK